MKLPSIKVHQIYFQDRQRPFLSSLFVPYLNEVTDEFYEAGVFQREFQNGTHLKADYTGFVSWKFEQKSFVSAKDFLGLEKDSPGREAYFLNPFPELTGRHKNVWVQGAVSHPGLLMLAQSIFDHVGVKVSLLDMTNGPDDTAYCNYWYGSRSFWDEYMNFCSPFYQLLSDRQSPFYKEIRASAKYHGGGTLIPFFMERLFPTFLALRPDITRLAFQWTPERSRDSLELMRDQLNLCEAKLDEIRKAEEAYPRWKRWLVKRG